jgi:hypothetical protein
MSFYQMADKRMLLFAIHRLDIHGIASQPFHESLQPNANNSGEQPAIDLNDATAGKTNVAAPWSTIGCSKNARHSI